ncbi:MAG: TolC family protein [Marinilabiliaceae bacterium]
MTRLFIALALCAACAAASGQSGSTMTLQDYVDAAKRYSPLLNDFRSQAAVQQAERMRLKAMHTHSRLELNGECLFVPVISNEDGRTFFEWDAQDGADYYGYDLGESSTHLHTGLTWTKPLLGRGAFRAESALTEIAECAADNSLRMEEHALERSVAERYLICVLDEVQVDFADSVDALLHRQTEVVRRLAQSGMARQSDVRLLQIERQANKEAQAASRQSLSAHVADLNILCGLTDTTSRPFASADAVTLRATSGGASLFAEQYRLDSLRVCAELDAFDAQYRPRLDLTLDAGMRTGDFAQWNRHFGWSAGLTFAWTIFDGRQRRWKERQSLLQQSTIAAYKSDAERQRALRKSQCLKQLADYDNRARILNAQIIEYDSVIADYDKEMRAGQRSVLDFITVLRSKVRAERDLMTLMTNRQLVVAAYNYWNW